MDKKWFTLFSVLFDFGYATRQLLFPLVTIPESIKPLDAYHVRDFEENRENGVSFLN